MGASGGKEAVVAGPKAEPRVVGEGAVGAGCHYCLAPPRGSDGRVGM